MSFTAEKLYALLPALYRIRDTDLAGANEDGSLKALLSVIAEQAAVLEENLDQLYNDQFIETCTEWVVPYIGDLVGTRGLFVSEGLPFSNRAQVANTIAYRRRKGTAAVIEQLARDVTAWNASVVEYFQILATTQYMKHMRAFNLATPDLRDGERLERLGTPFETISRIVEVRRIEPRRGKYNIPNIGVFLWRIGAYSRTLAPASQVDARRYRFDPLGRDTQLYTFPEAEETITHLATSFNVPAPISRRVLDRYLESYYGPGRSLLLIVNGSPVIPQPASPPAASPPGPGLADLISSCDLRDVAGGWAHPPVQKIAIDPVLGRIFFPSSQPPPVTVEVTYHYGFTTDMGGGEYPRAATFAVGLEPLIQVPSQEPVLQAALDAVATSGGVAEIADNAFYNGTLLVQAPAQGRVEFRAADERCPILVLGGDLTLVGGPESEVTLNGLLISTGRIQVPVTDASGNPNALRRLQIRHCTLVPMSAQPSIVVEAANVIVELEASIVGMLRVTGESQVRVVDSIIDSTAETGVAYAAPDGSAAGAPLGVENSTIIGKVHTREMMRASNTIFFSASGPGDTFGAPVLADRLQQGCVRFSFVPLDARVPRRFRCQPNEVSQASSVRPVFNSLDYGNPAYCQLSLLCAAEIREGADDGSEMGALHQLFQPQRKANLRARLDEYLRFGLEAGIFYAT